MTHTTHSFLPSTGSLYHCFTITFITFILWLAYILPIITLLFQYVTESTGSNTYATDFFNLKTINVGQNIKFSEKAVNFSYSHLKNFSQKLN